MADEAIFIGYRRDDTADVAGRLYDAMAARFGKHRVFKDVDNIGPGVDFGDYIRSILPRCRVALILIGPHWLESKDHAGERRIDDAHDWVRVEIETALATPGVLVVPVLVNGASMPRGEDVPDSLKPLLRRHAAVVGRDPGFHADVERLAQQIGPSINADIAAPGASGGGAGAAAPVTRTPKSNSRAPLLIGGAVAAVLALGVIGFALTRLQPTQVAAETAELKPAPNLVPEVERPAQEAPPQQPPPQQPAAQEPPAVAPAQSAATGTPASTGVEAPARAQEPARAAVARPNLDFSVSNATMIWVRPSPNGEARVAQLALTLRVRNNGAAPVRFLPYLYSQFEVQLENGERLYRSATNRNSVCVDGNWRRCRASKDGLYVTVPPGGTGEFDLSLSNYIAIGGNLPIDGYATGTLNVSVLIDPGSESDTQVLARVANVNINIDRMR